MDEELKQSNQQGEGKKPFLKLIWLLCAFIPSLVAIPCLGIKNMPQWLGLSLLMVNAGCSLFAGIGLLSGIKDPAIRVILGVLLGGFFFVLNVIIVIFIGCSGMGRIAP